MNVNKRLDILESQLGVNTTTDVLLVAFVKPGEIGEKLTHIWSKEGGGDCYLMDGETDDEFADRAAKQIRKLNNIEEKHALMMFGDREEIGIPA